MCRSDDSEGSLLPLLSLKVRAMQARAEAALRSSTRREDSPHAEKQQAEAKKKPRAKSAAAR